MPEGKTSPERRPLINRQVHQGQFFTEALNESTHLDMMLIPGGTFEMGQTAAEKAELIRLMGDEFYQKYLISELPRHSVSVSLFFMGKYPVTQAQWRAVAAYQPVDQKLELKPDPSNFKGDNHPVEQVSWQDAQEFCQRLSVMTGRTYRLPSEAEWEYACRAGTTTPFHFGETLSDELANYCAQDREIDGTSYKGTYGRGVLGQFREATTEVGKFPANPFGLYDMHGNVLEWCEDDWHSNYEGAPSDGSAWVELDRSNTSKLVRGGSWGNDPRHCRSASRLGGNEIHYSVGFRVVCEPPRILLNT
jgi:formylglycine-generating enzyme required for sulfatase activity